MIDKRIPFGFLGEWGKVYKLYNSDEKGWGEDKTFPISLGVALTGDDEIIFKARDKYIKLYINDTLVKTMDIDTGYRLKNYTFKVGQTTTTVAFEYLRNGMRYKINDGEWQVGNVVLTMQIIDPNYEGRTNPIIISYTEEKEYLMYSQSRYVDIGQDVQFKCVGNRVLEYTQPVKNLAADSEHKTIMTGDATWDNGRYKCVVAVGDIVWYDNLYWVVEKLVQEEVYYPNEQAVWTINIKRIYEEILTGA